MTTQERTEVILDQLARAEDGQGRRNLTLRLGAGNITTVTGGLRFDFRSSRNWNGVEIMVNDQGNYDVQFWKTGPENAKLSPRFHDILPETLPDMFEKETDTLTSISG
jgi:hypothetical protein